MKTDYRAVIGPYHKSPLRSICEMFEWHFHNLCAVSTDQHIATAWIVRSQLSLSWLENVD